MGSIRDAFLAGYMPNTTPTATETPNAIPIEAGVTIVFHSAARAINHDRKYPNAMPTTPPPIEIRMDSKRNCRTMSPRRAPIDRRIPISRVRSSTVASTMFMIPMPPTSSEIAAIATIT